MFTADSHGQCRPTTFWTRFGTLTRTIGRMLQDPAIAPPRSRPAQPAGFDRPLNPATLAALDAIRRASDGRYPTAVDRRRRPHDPIGGTPMAEPTPRRARASRGFSLATNGRLMTRESLGSGVTTRSLIISEPTRLSLLCWRAGRSVQPPFITIVRQGDAELTRHVDNLWRMTDLDLGPGLYVVELINLGDEDVHLEMIRSAMVPPGVDLVRMSLPHRQRQAG